MFTYQIQIPLTLKINLTKRDLISPESLKNRITMETCIIDNIITAFHFSCIKQDILKSLYSGEFSVEGPIDSIEIED